MKILHIDTGEAWRGGQNQVFLLIRELKKYGVSQSLISPPGSPLSRKIKKMEVNSFSLSPRNDLDIISGYKLRKIVRKLSPHIIHFHTAKALGTGSWALQGLKLRKIYTKRVDFPITGGVFARLKYGTVDVIVPISAFIEKQLKEAGFENVQKIYSAVDVEKYEQEITYEKKNTVAVGMAGELDLKHKDFFTFIKAAALAAEKSGFPELKFFIAGSGKDENKIRGLINKLNLDEKIHLEGFIENIQGFYSKIDILVHTVNYEGLGTVLLQAMACGLPVIATQTGGIPEIVENKKDGFLVKKKQSPEVSSKIIQLAEDPELRKRMGRKGKEKVKSEFSPSSMAEKYMSIYEELGSKRK